MKLNNKIFQKKLHIKITKNSVLKYTLNSSDTAKNLSVQKIYLINPLFEKMLVAYLVNETSGERYHLFRIMTIRYSNCDISLTDPTIPIMRIYQVRNKDFVYLYCNDDAIIGHVYIDGIPVSSDDGCGFGRELYNFSFFHVSNTNYRVYIIRNKETLVEKTVFNRRLLPMARVRPQQRESNQGLF